MSPKQVILLVSTAFWWGAAYVWAGLALEGFSPILLVALRLVLATAALAVAVQVFGGGVREALRLFRRRPAAVTLLAVSASAAPFGLITSGQQHVPAGTTAVLIATVPLWTAVLGVWMDRGETIGRRRELVQHLVEELELAERRAQFVGDRPVDQHEHHPHRLVGAVRPRVVGAALDDGVARPDAGLGAVVEQQPRLALEHDADVERLGPVHRRLGARAISVNRTITPLAGGGVRIGRSVGSVWWLRSASASRR